ncbi:MAG: hypothetical protein K0S74_596 [Chlamydiales bacterium]|jgi:hypothetical protein|nr:hypothetical protein [Chlamydiales bacterium]
MTSKNFWDDFQTWEQAESAWDLPREELIKQSPLNSPKHLPNIPGITQETKKNLKWKSLKYMVKHDHEGKIRKNFLRHPFRYGAQFIRSAYKTEPFKIDGDFYLYGVESVDDFISRTGNVSESILVVGFSYCHKPHECPSGRFNESCIRDPAHSVCRQCFIGKSLHALPQKNVVPLVISTIHYIGEKMFDVVHHNPGKEILFVISACELCLKMFADWGNMVNAKGIGIRLDGRICNTMKAFELSEIGIKPGLTVILEATQKRVLDIIRCRREASFS